MLPSQTTDPGREAGVFFVSSQIKPRLRGA